MSGIEQENQNLRVVVLLENTRKSIYGDINKYKPIDLLSLSMEDQVYAIGHMLEVAVDSIKHPNTVIFSGGRKMNGRLVHYAVAMKNSFQDKSALRNS